MDTRTCCAQVPPQWLQQVAALITLGVDLENFRACLIFEFFFLALAVATSSSRDGENV